MARKTFSEKIKRATLNSIIKESDKGCVILAASLVEDALTRLHRASICSHFDDNEASADNVYESLVGQYGPLSTFAGKIDLAFAYGLINEDEWKKLHVLRKLRNEAAHCNFDFKLNDPGIKRTVESLKLKTTFESSEGNDESNAVLAKAGLDPDRMHFSGRTFILRSLLIHKLVNVVAEIATKRKKMSDYEAGAMLAKFMLR